MKVNNVQTEKSKAKTGRLAFLPVALVWLALVVCAFLLPKHRFSDSERRNLAQFPAMNTDTLLSGNFMTEFETFSLDQFPLRDSFRSLKTFSSLYLFGQNANNDLYLSDGYIVKQDYPLNEASLNNALQRLEHVYTTYLEGKDMNLFLSIIPDKAYFLKNNANALTLDYDALVQTMKDGMPYASYIDIFNTLSIEDYYKTDTHWRQEELLPTAETLAAGLGVSIDRREDYSLITPMEDFYGVYYGQLALPLPGEPLHYLNNELLDSCTVENIENPDYNTIYTLSKLTAKDPYELFLSGSAALLTITNPNAQNNRELIVFRDSYGSSLLPLLVSGYSKVTLIDIRYISSAVLDKFVEFNQQDVLFLYSTLLLNSSFTMK